MDSPSSDHPGRPLVVLLDDEPRILASLVRLFRTEPLEALATECPDEALEWIRTREVRMVIADYRMPEIDGVRFLEGVRDLSPQVVRLMITGYPDESMVVDCRKRGLLEVIPKPWNNDQLKKLVLHRLSGRRSESPSVCLGAREPSPTAP